jgi:hypothetical protein
MSLWENGEKLYGDIRERVAAKFRGSKGVRVNGPTEKKNPYFIFSPLVAWPYLTCRFPTLNRQMNYGNRDKSFPTL